MDNNQKEQQQHHSNVEGGDIIDESLYSRQLYVLGHEAMRKMQQANVLIIGLHGTGVELAKNVILAGVKSVTLHDPQLVSAADLGSQFFLTEQDIGKPRDASCVSRLAELNEYVPVRLLPSSGLNETDGEQLRQIIKDFQVVALCDASEELELRIDALCHGLGVALVAPSVKGLTGKIFCDFGEAFLVSDDNGEQPLSGLIGGVVEEEGERWTVSCLEESRHGLEDGQVVAIKDVFKQPISRSIKVHSPQTFSVPREAGDALDDKAVLAAKGSFDQVKQPLPMVFQPLSLALQNPQVIPSDFGKFEHQPILHELYYPSSHKQQESQSQQQELSELKEKITRASKGYLAPMASIIGSIAAQEVIKACTGKFKPIHQFFYFDALEVLPEDAQSDSQPLGSRYDHQIALFGQTFQRKLEAMRGFVVGSGAIGCELLKAFALMGIGHITVTDMDNIERSNLNRQFLFRSPDVGQPKSKTAADFVSRIINPQIHIDARQDRVGPETEAIFDDDFYSGLHFVANALDNVDARRYMDRRCVLFEKPLLESGTLGAKGNTQVVMPHMTESYSSSQDPPEKSIPFCTLHNFPNTIEHCIEWAMDVFKGSFTNDPLSVNSYLQSQLQPAQHHEKQQAELAYRMLQVERPLSYEDCLVWARNKFEELFHNNPTQLLFNFPLDAVTSSGTPFWSGPKRPPTPVTFDVQEPAHLGFVLGMARMRAEIYGLRATLANAQSAEFVQQIAVPVFVPKTGVKIQTDPSAQAVSEDSDLSAVVVEDFSVSPGTKMNIVEFEKDDDRNGHVDLLAVMSNLRAQIYGIELAERHQVKGIAGKIIPAIATTTALVAGLVALELYKVALEVKELGKFRNAFINLALPFFAFTEPVAPAVTKYGDNAWSLWDRFTFPASTTLRELIDWFDQKLKLQIVMLSSGSSMVYSPALALMRNSSSNNNSSVDKMEQRVWDLVKKPTHARSVILEALTEDGEGNDVEIPFIRMIK